MRVVLPSFGNKSRKTTKSDPSTGDQLRKCKCLFTFFSTEFRADLWVNGGSNNEPLTRWGEEAFGDLNRVIVAQIEQNDKVRFVYGGSVLRIERNGQVRSAGRSSRACATHGVQIRLSRRNQLTVRVVLPTFGSKSRKTTKSDPTTGDQLGKSVYILFNRIPCPRLGKRRE